METQSTNLQRLTESLPRNVVLKEQPDKDATKGYIAKLLIRLSEIYAIQNFQVTSALHLADWVMVNYRYESLNLVIETLQNPPLTEEKVWRLNPDTIGAWMRIALEKLAERREIFIHNKKQEEAQGNQWTDERLKEWKQIIEQSEGPMTKSPRMSEQEIREEGQTRPKHPLYRPTTMEEAIIYDMHIQWIRECFDPISGKPNANYLSEEEWRRTQK